MLFVSSVMMSSLSNPSRDHLSRCCLRTTVSLHLSDPFTNCAVEPNDSQVEPAGCIASLCVNSMEVSRRINEVEGPPVSQSATKPSKKTARDTGLMRLARQAKLCRRHSKASSRRFVQALSANGLFPSSNSDKFDVEQLSELFEAACYVSQADSTVMRRTLGIPILHECACADRKLIAAVGVPDLKDWTGH